VGPDRVVVAISMGSNFLVSGEIRDCQRLAVAIHKSDRTGEQRYESKL
jgi:hypothetical protein